MDATLSRTDIERMIAMVDPAVQVHELRPAERGHSEVYHLQVTTPDGECEYVLKAVADENHRGIATEARLLALLDDRTGLPVPTVRGAVDEHDDVPAPFFLMESMPGRAHQFEETPGLADGQLQRLARQTGAYLGQLHALDVVDSFGTVRHDEGSRCRGGRPPSTPDGIRVSGGADAWPAFLREMVAHELDGHAETAFSDLTPALRAWFDGALAALSDQHVSVVGRIDHGVHNLLVEDSEITAMLDWEFALAVTPGYDLQCVEYVLSGAVLSTTPDRPDRRELVRTAMVDGYESAAGTPPGALAEYRESHDIYELLAVVRSMNHLDAGLAKVPAAREREVAAGLRTEAEAVLASEG